ncbi:MAG: hypothetical protein CTY20_02825 [Hyphomicrobium sp.]|nr:MAG: hypothetical protein CTY20_02825 [Hyphomicrobium sp.]
MFLLMGSATTTRADSEEWLANAFSTPAKTGKSVSGVAGSKRRGKANGDPQDSSAVTDGSTSSDKKPDKPDVLIGDHFAPSVAGKWQWRVTRTSWTETDEAAYGDFLVGIGESDCKTTHECLTSPSANPIYHARNPPGMQFFADCADLPYVLRGYFAWMNGLPFSFSTAVDRHPGSDTSKGSAQSFQIIGRYHIVPPGPDGRLTLPEISRVSTAHFRTPAVYRAKLLPDYYPVRIDRGGVRAGTVIFDPLGHIAIVYKVTEDGVAHFIDGHPDNTLTRGIFGSEIERWGPESGSGFKRWRPQRLVGATQGRDGRLHGGRVVLANDSELSDWSEEQYYGTGDGHSDHSRAKDSAAKDGRARDWRSAKFAIDGNEIDFYGFVRLRLANKGFKFNPVDETRIRIRATCQELAQRVDAVDAAIKAGMHQRRQPPRLPNNIYVTQGDWETYATPSRDAQLKNTFRVLREDVERFLNLSQKSSPFIRYDGNDLRQDLMETYEAEAANCNITYIKSDGVSQTLGFKEIKSRLFKMSFDPHHCVERRWGATSSVELASCPDDKLKSDWYDAQQRLRNEIVRTIGDRMDFTIEDLRRHAREDSKFGDAEPPVIDVAPLFRLTQ